MTFRPPHQPAQRIFDALVDEATKRNTTTNWMHNEKLRVYREARDYAVENDQKCPTLDQVKNCEMLAVGHVDYAAKWAYAVAEKLKELNRKDTK